MGKQPCCICKKEMGMLEIKFTRTDVGDTDDPRVLEMSKEDRLCDSCKKEIKKVSKEAKKEEFSAQIDELNKRSIEYKRHWDKNGIIQFKNERIAILKRAVGAQVEFIVAFDDMTKDGYRLMAIDEGVQGSSGSLAGGINAYFYFQKMEFVR